MQKSSTKYLQTEFNSICEGLYTMTRAGPLISRPVLLGNRMPTPVPPNVVLSPNQVEPLDRESTLALRAGPQGSSVPLVQDAH